MKKFLLLAVAAATFSFTVAQASACCGGCPSGKDKGSESAGAKS